MRFHIAFSDSETGTSLLPRFLGYGMRHAYSPSVLTRTPSTETMTYRAALAELRSTMTSRQVETLIKWVMSAALEGCVHSWIADEAHLRFGVRSELVRGLLVV